MDRSHRRKPLRILLWVALAAVGLTGLVRGGEPTGDAKPHAPYRAALIPIDGDIDNTLVASVERRIEKAIAEDYDLFIFHITSYGGGLTAGLDLATKIDRLPRRGIRTVAFVDAKAISAAALTALACQEIVMTPEAAIGDCAPIAVSATGGITPLPDVEREKLESVTRDRMESLAEEHGIPPALGAAMVTMRITVVRAKNRDTGETRYVQEDKLFDLGPTWEKDVVVDGPDTLLAVGSKKALEYGIARHIVNRLDDLYTLYPIDGELHTLPVTWSEGAVQAMNNLFLRALLVLVGLLGLYVEMHTPGFGVPGTIGLAALALLFAGSILAGNPNWLAPLVFVVGLVLLFIEVFITPGFGVMGVTGILLIVTGILLALSNLSRWPQTDFEWSRLYEALAATVGVLAVFAVLAWLLARFFPRLPILRHLVLAPSTVSDGSSRAAAAPQESTARVGEIGRATSILRPAGKARFDDRLVDVVTEGDFLAPGAAVRVVRLEGNRGVVRAVGDSPPASPTGVAP